MRQTTSIKSRLCRLVFTLLLFGIVLANDLQGDHDEEVLSPVPDTMIHSESVEAALNKLRILEQDSKPTPEHSTVFVTTLKDGDFGKDIDLVSVQINGDEVSGVLLHGNGEALSFIIPDEVMNDGELQQSSEFEIFINGVSLSQKPPLTTLTRTARKLDFADFRMEHDPSNSQSRFEEEQDDDEDEVEVDDDTGHFEHPTDDSEVTESHSGDDEATLSTEKKRDDDHSRLEVLMGSLPFADGAEKDANKMRIEAENGNSVAMTQLAANQLSSGHERDIPGAVQLLRKAAILGDADAQSLLAFLHASGAAVPVVPKSIGKAILLWHFAAQGGSQYGKIALAYRYFIGLDVSEDCDQAARMYEEVAFNVLKQVAKRNNEVLQRHDEAGSADTSDKASGKSDGVVDVTPPTHSDILGMSRTRLHDEIQPRFSRKQQDVVQYHLHAARRGDADAMVFAGNLYYYGGLGVAQDLRHARDLFERASRAGRMDAHTHLGFMDLRAGRNQSAYAHFSTAAETGNAMAHHGLGLAFLNGIFVDENPIRAQFHFKEAAKKKVPEALYNLGIMHVDGHGDEIARDAQEAYKYFVDAANLGHMKARYMIGRMSMRGIAPAREDCAVASRSFKLVAEHGAWDGVLGRALQAYEKGRFRTALYRYLQAAHAGVEVAQFNAAYMYDIGQTSDDAVSPSPAPAPSPATTERDDDAQTNRSFALDQALELYKMSASSGSSNGAPEAMLRMGDMLYRERQDFTKAAVVYERAAKLKNAEALFNLGVMHAFGRGLQRNTHLAKRYFDEAKAADQRAVLPATMAVFALRYPKSLLFGQELLAGVADVWKTRAWPKTLSVGDPSIVLLLAALAVVLNIRALRQLALRNEEDDDDDAAAAARGGNAALFF